MTQSKFRSASMGIFSLRRLPWARSSSPPAVRTRTSFDRSAPCDGEQ